MSVSLIPTTVTSGKSGEVVDAVVLRCCGQERFKVFQLMGQNHPHLQCCECGTSYCAGACDGMEAL